MFAQLETNRAALEYGGEVGTLRALGEGRVQGNRLQAIGGLDG